MAQEKIDTEGGARVLGLAAEMKAREKLRAKPSPVTAKSRTLVPRQN